MSAKLQSHFSIQYEIQHNQIDENNLSDLLSIINIWCTLKFLKNDDKKIGIFLQEVAAAKRKTRVLINLCSKQTNGRYQNYQELVVSKLDINQIENYKAILKHQLQKQTDLWKNEDKEYLEI